MNISQLKIAAVKNAASVALLASAFATPAWSITWDALVAREGFSAAQQACLLSNTGCPRGVTSGWTSVTFNNQVYKSLTRTAPGVRAYPIPGFSNQQLLAGATSSRSFPRETLAPVFRELVVYRMVNATPSETAGVFYNLGAYDSVFASVLMHSARALNLSGNVQPAGPPVPVSTNPLQFDIRFVKGARLIGSFNVAASYDLRNEWVRFNSAGGVGSEDSYRVLWSSFASNAQTYYSDASGGNSWSPIQTGDYTTAQSVDGDVHFVEGMAEFETVAMPDGSSKTLLKYYNYINPVDDQSPSSFVTRARNSGFRVALNTDPARNQNRDELMATIQAMGDRAQLHNNRVTTSGRAGICGLLPVASCANP